MPAENNNPASPANNSKVTSVPQAPDARQRALQTWLQQVGISDQGEAASSDAGFRRYFRFKQDGRTLIAMDAPPATEDCRPFIKVAGMLSAAGVTVPEILAQDLEQGFLLLSDLGPHTYLDTLMTSECDSARADALYRSAIQALIKIQQIDVAAELPRYDEALLRRELDLFPEWYLRRDQGIELSEETLALLSTVFQQLIDAVMQQAYVFVHRDFMPRNLMTMTDDVGVLDFQDAVLGPVSYDPICLFKDAFISWPESQVEQWLQQYWQQARAAGIPVPDTFDEFLRDCDYMGAQRHLKVIGIFARICHRDGKPHYLKDVPRFFAYLTTVAKRRPELALGELLAHLGALS